MDLDITEIRVESRFRKDQGDIDGLAKSIAELGLLQPVVVDGDNRLIAGGRRLLAVRQLGWKSIPAFRVGGFHEAVQRVKAERDENTCRKEFAPTEYVAIGQRLEALLKPQAEARKGARTDTPMGKLPAGKEFGRVRDQISKAVGASGSTYEKAKKVVEAVKANPGLVTIAEEMDKTGNVHRAFRALQRVEAVKKVAETPSEKYRVIYADPPWKYGDTRNGLEGTTGAEAHYPTMSISELSALPVAEWCEENAVLFLWVTSPLLFECAPVISAWGFKYKACFVWDKVKHNLGHYNSVRHEFLLICTRGSCTPDNMKLMDSVQSIERSDQHSQKPEEFRTMIDTLYPHGNRLEMFARTQSKGWQVWGNGI